MTVITFAYLFVLRWPALNPAVSVPNEPLFGAGVSSRLKVTTTPETLALPMPPLLELPQVCVASYSSTICLS